MAGITNVFRPTALSFNSYGWKGSPQYNSADVPTKWVEGTGDRTILEQQFAYEWLDSSSPYTGQTNPPFTTSAAGRLLPELLNDQGLPARILRGFIRRAEYDNSDPTSMARMYFMYNPETITRQYVSYLDQGALDPFNTIYQSGNLVAPPSYMDFSFSLFFDRQQEAMDQTHPGVFVDYQFFDLVVRNVVPVVDPNNNASTQLPDNGVMMVNPRDITVVFSPQITVQGRPSNAQVSFQRFTHRMVPTRMQIDLTMRVVYFGPMKDMVQYARETIDVQSTVHWRDDMGMQLNITNDQIQAWKQNSTEWISGLDSNANATDAQTSLNAQGASSGGASGDLMAKVVAFAIQKGKDNGLTYGGIQHRMNLWKQSDCSSFVWAAFAYYQDPNSSGNLASKMGWPTPPQNGGQAPSTDAMLLQFRGPSATAHATKLWDVDKSASASTRASQIQAGINQNPFQVGDLIFRERGLNGRDVGHVAFYNGGTSSTINLCDNGGPYGAPFSPSRPTSIAYIEANYNAAYRPLPLGSGMQANAGGN